jgi:hypothetical protein
VGWSSSLVRIDFNGEVSRNSFFFLLSQRRSSRVGRNHLEVARSPAFSPFFWELGSSGREFVLGGGLGWKPKKWSSVPSVAVSWYTRTAAGTQGMDKCSGIFAKIVLIGFHARSILHPATPFFLLFCVRCAFKAKLSGPVGDKSEKGVKSICSLC